MWHYRYYAFDIVWHVPLPLSRNRSVTATKSLTANSMRSSVSRWLRRAMDEAGLNQSTLAARSGVARETVWRLLHEKTDANEWTLRRLAEATGRPAPGAPAANGAPGAAGPPDGWLFGDPTFAEQQFIAFLRNIERTTRAMVGDPDLFAAEEHRINQLAVCRAAMRSAELAGRPVPTWLTRIHNEVIGGEFG